MVEVLLDRFLAVVSDVCACLMGFKVRLDHFWRNSAIKWLIVNFASQSLITLHTHNSSLEGAMIHSVGRFTIDCITYIPFTCNIPGKKMLISL